MKVAEEGRTEAEQPWSWSSETIQEFDSGGAADNARIRVVSEVPQRKDGTPLPRRGNRWYPTMVEVWLGYRDERGEEMTCTMLLEDARHLADALRRGADIAEATDKADVDTCGHWWPCSREEPHDS